MTESALQHLGFWKALLTRPRHVGAIVPSGPVLANAMAAQVDPNVPGPILELGPGTGVVTQALTARGIAPERIVAVEYDPEFAAMVQRRFPKVTVIRGDAFDLDKTLAAHPMAPLAAAVSSLPLVNFPHELRSKVLRDVFSRLAPGAPFVQFSYRFGPPLPPPDGVTLRKAAVIWRNLPPARVWVYRRDGRWNARLG